MIAYDEVVDDLRGPACEISNPTECPLLACFTYWRVASQGDCIVYVLIRYKPPWFLGRHDDSVENLYQEVSVTADQDTFYP